jgi:hypothetical protein
MTSTLRTKLIRLAHENPALRADLLPLLSKKAATFELYDEALKVVRTGWMETARKLELIQTRAASIMGRQGWILDEPYSGISISGRGGDDGKWLDGQLAFIPADKKYSWSSTSAEAVFEMHLGLDGKYSETKRQWLYRFDR